MELTVTGVVFEWRGPSPYHFVALGRAEAEVVREVAREVTYGWGMIPVSGRVGTTTFTTSLWPRDGTYVVPLKDAVRRAEDVSLGDVVTVSIELEFG